MQSLLRSWVLLLLFGLPSVASAFSFPEFGFCPLGGPPGWFNRMTGQHHKRYYRPPPLWRPAPPVTYYAPTVRFPAYTIAPYPLQPPGQ